MRIFLQTMAVALGLANALLYSLLGDDSSMGPFDWKLQRWPESALYVLTGVVAALLISGAFMKFAGRELRGNFFGRYGLMVMAICFGGALMGPLLLFVTFSLGTNVYVPSSPSEIASMVAFAVVVGWIVGAVEGVILALAGLLGVFSDRTAPQAQSQP